MHARRAYSRMYSGVLCVCVSVLLELRRGHCPPTLSSLAARDHRPVATARHEHAVAGVRHLEICSASFGADAVRGAQPCAQRPQLEAPNANRALHACSSDQMPRRGWHIWRCLCFGNAFAPHGLESFQITHEVEDATGDVGFAETER